MPFSEDSSKDPLTKSFPTSKEVEDFHRNSDRDKRPESQHHTIGSSRNQASPGDHNHQDGRSVPLLDGILFTGIVGTYNATTFRQVLAALVKLGASDATT